MKARYTPAHSRHKAKKENYKREKENKKDKAELKNKMNRTQSSEQNWNRDMLGSCPKAGGSGPGGACPTANRNNKCSHERTAKQHSLIKAKDWSAVSWVKKDPEINDW